jgi:hypothetical protein
LTVNTALAVFVDASLASTVCDPCAPAGTTNVAEKLPDAVVDGVAGLVVRAIPSYLIVAGEDDAAKPTPVTVMMSPTYPLAALTDPPLRVICELLLAGAVLLFALQLRHSAVTV